MSQPALNPADYHRTLLAATIQAARSAPSKHIVAADATGASMTYRQMFTRAFILAAKLNAVTRNDRYVGVLLPNTLGVMVTFVALHMLGRVPAMLNYSSGATNLIHACKIAQLHVVLTSRLFVAKGKFEPLIEALAPHVRIIYLEDIRESVKPVDKLRGALAALAPARMLSKVLDMPPDEPAVVLYTSGSEGVPKGVALSHANILSNIAQVRLRLDIGSSDIVFNALPVFHSFGLSVGMLKPLVCGVGSYFYPSPVQYRQIPQAVYDSGATIMLGTDTFYNGYARYAEKQHFSRIRLAVAGAEKLRNPTREHWLAAYNVDILQGYGVTEASPVISVNIPSEHKPGTVGRLFPGMEAKLEPVEGLEKGGRLLVKGPNVMLGYLKVDQPGVIQPQGEWYDTGDIVDIDAEGYITILGRAKRFAKIAGEMVSLVVVEDMAHALKPEVAHAALAMADEKGEQIVLYTEAADLTNDMLIQYAGKSGIAKICLPRRIVLMTEIPRLGNGKIDYMTLKEKARAN